MDACRSFASAGSNAAQPILFEPMVMSILLFQQGKLRKMEKELDALKKHFGQSKPVRGWIFDVYPSNQGEVAVWVIGEDGERIRLVDGFQPRVYISGTQEDIKRLASTFYRSSHIAWWGFAYKYAHPLDAQKSEVLEVTLKDCRRTAAFTRDILKMGDYLRYEIFNCDLQGDRMYLFNNDIFPLAHVEIENGSTGLQYNLLDSVQSNDYSVPPLRVMKLSVEIAKKGKISNFDDPIGKIVVTQANKQVMIDLGSEGEKLLWLARIVKELDPDIVLTSGGDSYLFPYFIHRATDVASLMGLF